MKLLLIRHGQTASNVARLLDTAVPGPPLTELGQRQAEAVVEALADAPIASIYASNQLRAQLTARPLAVARGLDITIRDGLREIGAGRWEGRNDEEAVKGYVSTVVRWVQGDLDARIDDGPNGAETLARFTAVVDEIAEAAQRDGCTAPDDPATVVVSHGAMLRVWAGIMARNVTPEFMRDTPLRNTGLIELHRVGDGEWHAERWMDHIADDAGSLVPSGPLEDSVPAPVDAGGAATTLNPGF